MFASIFGCSENVSICATVSLLKLFHMFWWKMSVLHRHCVPVLYSECCLMWEISAEITGQLCLKAHSGFVLKHWYLGHPHPQIFLWSISSHAHRAGDDLSQSSWQAGFSQTRLWSCVAYLLHARVCSLPTHLWCLKAAVGMHPFPLGHF